MGLKTLTWHNLTEEANREKTIQYQVLRKTIGVFHEFEKVTSGMYELCIGQALEWRLYGRDLFSL